MKAKYIFAIAFLIIAGCKKETARLTSGLQGTWELVSSDGGWSGHQEYEPGNGNTLSFSSNTYSRTLKTADTIYQYSGTFRVYTGKPCYYANEQTLIEFDNNSIPGSFSLSHEKLILGATECVADFPTSTYRKIE